MLFGNEENLSFGLRACRHACSASEPVSRWSRATDRPANTRRRACSQYHSLRLLNPVARWFQRSVHIQVLNIVLRERSHEEDIFQNGEWINPIFFVIISLSFPFFFISLSLFFLFFSFSSYLSFSWLHLRTHAERLKETLACLRTTIRNVFLYPHFRLSITLFSNFSPISRVTIFIMLHHRSYHTRSFRV